MTNSPARASDMRADLKKAAKLGRGGDDRIAHINSYEAAVLRGLGGAGTINPKTGIEEFYQPEGGGGKASDTGSGGRNSGRDRDRPGQSSGGQGGRGGGSFGGGPSSVGSGLSGRQRNLRDIENLGAGRPSSMDGASGKPSTGQQGRGGGTFQGQNVPGNPSAPGYLDGDSQMTTVQGKPVSVGELRNDYHDYDGLGDTFADQIGNFIAGGFGFNEENPFDDKDYADNDNPTGQGANWGFDPVPGLVGIGSMLAGLPFGPGMIANQISSAFGHPLAFDLGPSALTSETIDPESGQVVSNTTHTGPNMTVRDADNPNEYFGMSPGLAAVAGGASNAIPSKRTFMGADPTTPEPATEAPYQPVTPAPSPIDTPPNSPIQIDPGNTSMSSDELTRLFLGFMTPGRTSRGRNPASVIV